MTSSALALGSVLAAGGDSGFHAPGLAEFYPATLFDFTVAGIEFQITRITFIMWGATLLMLLFMYLAVRRPQIVPGRMQFIGESGYSLVRDGIARDVIGPKGVPFAPFLSALFFFILVNNLMSIIPFAQISPMAKFAFPLLLAVICWVMYIWVGIREQGLWPYFRDMLFMPGVPKAMHGLIAPLELLQNIVVRPFTLSVRLFANLFAGHMLLVVFAVGATYLFSLGGIYYAAGVASALMQIIMTFFELLIAVLQAYIFTILMGTYLNGSIEAAH